MTLSNRLDAMLRDRLTQRLHLSEVQELSLCCTTESDLRESLFTLVFDDDDRVSQQALWVFTHGDKPVQQWLYSRQALLIDLVLSCSHSTKKRLILTLLERQPDPSPLRIDLLNFCLDHMADPREPPAVQSLCLKLAYRQCQAVPELLQELYTLLDFMEPDFMSPALQNVRQKILARRQTR